MTVVLAVKSILMNTFELKKRNVLDFALGSGLALGFIYFQGFLYLSSYFFGMGIPFYLLPFSLIAILGILSSIFPFILIFTLINKSIKNKCAFILFIILFFALPITFGQIIKKSGYSYSYGRMPIVYITYSTPLENNIKLMETDRITTSIWNGVTKNNSGNHSAIFQLYFESDDNLYIKATRDLKYTSFDLAVTSSSSNNLVKMTAGMFNNIYDDYVVLPKSKIESIRFLRTKYPLEHYNRQ